MAKQIADLGYTNLHIIDLTGARIGTSTLWSVLEDILDLGLSIQVGGGVRTLEQVKLLIAKGVARVIVSTSALTVPDFLSDLLKYIGARRVVLSLDIRNRLIGTHGWSRYLEKSVSAILQSYPSLKNVIVTDIDQDGTLSSNVNYPLYLNILNEFPHINLIAAGGISSIDSIDGLGKMGCAACIVGRGFYEIADLRKEIVTRGFHRGEIC